MAAGAGSQEEQPLRAFTVSNGGAAAAEQGPIGFWARRTCLELVLGAALAVVVAAAVAIGIAFGVWRAGSGDCISPLCLHALGGGPVRSGGGIDSISAPRCQAQLHAYARSGSGAYWKEVQLAAQSAMIAFNFTNMQQLTPGRAATAAAAAAAAAEPRSHAHAAAVSRSLLAGTPNWQQQQQQQQQGAGAGDTNAWALGGPLAGLAPVQAPSLPAPSNNQVVVFDIDETVLSNLPQILHPERWAWDAWVAAARAPPLEPTRAFYRALCAAGYSVGFVTGRKEASRNATMANLEAAGYGRPCQAGTGPWYGTRNSSTSSGNDGGCCYTALYLRQPGDARLASVYKPWARNQLLQVAGGGMRLLALVGDQFSDLNGEHSAPLAFKLPNPFYFIL